MVGLPIIHFKGRRPEYYDYDVLSFHKCHAVITLNKKALVPRIAHLNPYHEERMFTTKYKFHFSKTEVLLEYHSDHNQSLPIH